MNARSKQKRSQVGVELVRLLAAEGNRIFTTGRARELSGRVGLKDSYLWEALHHLRRTGWIVPLKRGLYALSSTVPGVSPVHEFEIAMALVTPAAISHWSAMSHHGLTDQAPRKTFVLTTTDASIPRTRGHNAGPSAQGYTVGEAVYHFVQVKPERFFGTERTWIGDARVTFTDLERTLLDGLSMPQYCGDFSEVLHAFGTASSRLDIQKITGHALKLDKVTAKRLGWVLERQGIPSDQLGPLEKPRLKAYLPLDPTGPRKGPCNRRWMVQENLPGRVVGQ